MLFRSDLAKIINESSLYLLNQVTTGSQFTPDFVNPRGFKHISQAQEDLFVDEVNSLSSKQIHEIPQNQLMKRMNKSTHFAHNHLGVLQSLFKDLFFFKPGLIHTSRSLRQGFVKIFESKKS